MSLQVPTNDYTKTGIPDPISPFTQSLALLNQISSLLDPEKHRYDYIVSGPT